MTRSSSKIGGISFSLNHRFACLPYKTYKTFGRRGRQFLKKILRDSSGGLLLNIAACGGIWRLRLSSSVCRIFGFPFVGSMNQVREEDGFRRCRSKQQSHWFSGGPRPPSTANWISVLFFKVVICIPQTIAFLLFSFQPHCYKGYYTRLQRKYQDDIKEFKETAKDIFTIAFLRPIRQTLSGNPFNFF